MPIDMWKTTHHHWSSERSKLNPQISNHLTSHTCDQKRWKRSVGKDGKKRELLRALGRNAFDTVSME
jgi:hypothetical protein